LSEGQEVVTAPYHIITKRLKDGSAVKKVSKEELLKTDKKKKKDKEE
jgi:hypothetical protein